MRTLMLLGLFGVLAVAAVVHWPQPSVQGCPDYLNTTLSECKWDIRP
ncbi:hypothetical protein ABIC03_003454 [Bradyrhizobium sp. RT6a]|jgi:hypothetical protein